MSPPTAGIEDEPVAVVIVMSVRAKMDDDGVQDDDDESIDAEEAEEAEEAVEAEEDQAGAGVEAAGRGRHRGIFGGFSSVATPQSSMQLNRRIVGEELNSDTATASTVGEKKRTHEVPLPGHSACAAAHKRVRLPPGSYAKMAEPRGRGEEPDMNMELVLSTGIGSNHFMGVTWHCKLGKWHATKGKTHLEYSTRKRLTPPERTASKSRDSGSSCNTTSLTTTMTSSTSLAPPRCASATQLDLAPLWQVLRLRVHSPGVTRRLSPRSVQHAAFLLNVPHHPPVQLVLHPPHQPPISHESYLPQPPFVPHTPYVWQLAHLLLVPFLPQLPELLLPRLSHLLLLLQPPLLPHKSPTAWRIRRR